METLVASLLHFFLLAALLSWGLGKLLSISEKSRKLVAFGIADVVMFSGALSLAALIIVGLYHFIALNTQPTQHEDTPQTLAE